MRNIKILILFLIVSGSVQAQQQVDSTRQKMIDAIRRKMIDSVRSARIDEAALKYPRIRQLTVTHQNNAEGDMSSKLLGNNFFRGRMRTNRTTVNMNIPLLTQNKNIAVASIGFVHQFFDLNKVTTEAPGYVVSEETRYVPMVNLAASFTRRDTLFNIPLSLTASLGGLFNPDFQSAQLRFLGILTVPIIRRENTNMTVGVILNIDPSSLTPFIPLISYSHKFKSLDIDLMADLPYRVALRKTIAKKNSLSAFSEMAGNNSFFGFDGPNPTLPHRMTFATTELKSGLMFEHRLTKKVVLSFSGGVNTTLQSRIFKVGAKQNDYLIKNKTGATPFVQVGFSMLPFWDPFKR
ncbi:DUF6268 family outer membrane beta-barrel protein [Dyadobacter endophyticus]|nr:DUF6268 family outer membrane beta-barrel protein [Dyadobacter endophyticus]